MVRHRKTTSIALLETADSHDLRDEPPAIPVGPSEHFKMRPSRGLISPRTLAAFVAFASLLAWLFFTPINLFGIFNLSKSQPRFHLLLPASSSNRNFCRLLLSAKVLNYPVPVLINWGAQETDDPYDMHLLKIQKVLDYLRAFPLDQQNDLILMVDAYDVWFQLPPEVLIRRYFEQRKIDESLLKAKYGKKVVKANNFQNTVFFSNDKACWPDYEDPRAACWAVPDSPLPRNAYGPTWDDTYFDAKKALTAYKSRPRWLNSGSIMGPVSDVKKMYETVSAFLKAHQQGKSDQFYFAEIWGMQEYSRMLTEKNATIPDVKPPDIENTLGSTLNTEFHMTLDYENMMFQPIGYFDPYLSFVQFDPTLQSGRPEGAPIPFSDVQELADDIRGSRPPLDAISIAKVKKASSKARMRQWSELPLLTNLITKHTSPIVHFMIEKEYRVKWWDRMWYAPFAKDLFESFMSGSDFPIMQRPLHGKLWRNTEKPVVDTFEDPIGKRDGAWSDKGSWLSWSSLCIEHEEYIFTADRRASYGSE